MKGSSNTNVDRKQAKWLWLSYVLSTDTPGYAGEPGLEVERRKSMVRGDSSNSSRLCLSSHLGTHVDAPLHFVEGGRAVESYQPEEWMFHAPLLVDLSVPAGSLVGAGQLAASLPAPSPNVDLLLIRTGHWRTRGEDAYWNDGPGFAAEVCVMLLERFPNLKAIGLDTISLTSYKHREDGRIAHRAFLGAGLRIFEDLSLGVVPPDAQPSEVIAMPLRFDRSDGAPCSIAARFD